MRYILLCTVSNASQRGEQGRASVRGYCSTSSCTATGVPIAQLLPCTRRSGA